MSDTWVPSTWTFKSDVVASKFEKHVREQLPWYETATEAVQHFGRHYIPQNGVVYDIGASTGNIGNALRETLDTRKATFVAIEESPEMSALYTGPETLVTGSALTYDYQPFDFAVCFLVLMFLPITQRRQLIAQLVSLVKPGGAILVVDKVHTPVGYVGTVIRRLTMQWKMNTGVEPNEIIAKELSLAGFQRPINPHVLLPGAEMFFQFGEFAGWIIEATATE